MVTLKKLLFALPFLFFFYLAFDLALPFLKSSDYLFSFDSSSLWGLVFLSLAIFITAAFFVLFATFSNSWKLVAPVIVLSGLSLFLIDSSSVLMIVPLAVAGLALVFWSLQGSLKTYLDFRPNNLLKPAMINLIRLLVIVVTIFYFASVNSQINKDGGFNVPDSILNLVSQFNPTIPGLSDNLSNSNLPQLSASQISLLKQHPELLQQYGLDSKMLDEIQNQQKSGSSVSDATLKGVIKSEFQTFINAHLSQIPIFLAALFFLSVYSVTGVISIFSRPLLSLIFWLLEKTGFVHYEVEQREVRKLVV